MRVRSAVRPQTQAEAHITTPSEAPEAVSTITGNRNWQRRLVECDRRLGQQIDGCALRINEFSHRQMLRNIEARQRLRHHQAAMYLEREKRLNEPLMERLFAEGQTHLRDLQHAEDRKARLGPSPARNRVIREKQLVYDAFQEHLKAFGKYLLHAHQGLTCLVLIST